VVCILTNSDNLFVFHMLQGTRLKGKLSKATQDKLLRSAKFSKPPSGATTMMMKRTMAANESDYVIDDADLRADAGGWALSAARRDFASEENDNNGKWKNLWSAIKNCNLLKLYNCFCKDNDINGQ